MTPNGNSLNGKLGLYLPAPGGLIARHASFLSLRDDMTKPRLTVGELWRVSLIERLPLRNYAAELGVVLAEPTIGDWSDCFHLCFVCGKKVPRQATELARLHTHHVQRRGSCHRAYRDLPINLMRVCLVCHEGAIHGENMPHARQLAYKWLMDQSGYGNIPGFVEAWLHVRDGAELKAKERVIAEEVQEQLAWIESEKILAETPGKRR